MLYRKTVGDALNLLKFNKFDSLAVYDENLKQHTAILHSFDVLSYAFALYLEQTDTKQSLVESQLHIGIESASVGELVQKMNLSQKLHLCDAKQALSSVMHLLVSGHRLLVKRVDTGGPRFQTLTQADVVRLIYSHKDWFHDETLQKQLNHTHMITTNFVSMYGEASAIEGFFSLYENGADAVAVIDKGGILVGGLAPAEFRGINIKEFDMLYLPVLQFLQKMAGSNSISPVRCTRGSTLDELLLKFHVSQVSTIWMVDNELRAVGVITLSSLLKNFVSAAQSV